MGTVEHWTNKGSQHWKKAWEAEREAHRVLRRLAGLGDLDMLGGSPGALPAPLHDTEYSRAVGHATLMESFAVAMEEGE